MAQRPMPQPDWHGLRPSDCFATGLALVWAVIPVQSARRAPRSRPKQLRREAASAGQGTGPHQRPNSSPWWITWWSVGRCSTESWWCPHLFFQKNLVEGTPKRRTPGAPIFFICWGGEKCARGRGRSLSAAWPPAVRPTPPGCCDGETKEGVLTIEETQVWEWLQRRYALTAAPAPDARNSMGLPPSPLRACKRSGRRSRPSSKPGQARSRGSSVRSFCRLLSRPQSISRPPPRGAHLARLKACSPGSPGAIGCQRRVEHHGRMSWVAPGRWVVCYWVR